MRRVMGLLAVGACAVLTASQGCGDGDAARPGGTPAALRPALTPGVAAAADGVVEWVIDGDTVVVRIDGRPLHVRMLGIDTPESVKRDAPVECFGPEASARTTRLLPRRSVVRLRTDPNAGLFDRYHRVLAYLTPRGAPITVNELLLREGFATVYVFDRAHPFTLVRRFRRAERAAFRARRGLWGACPAP